LVVRTARFQGAESRPGERHDQLVRRPEKSESIPIADDEPPAVGALEQILPDAVVGRRVGDAELRQQRGQQVEMAGAPVSGDGRASRQPEHERHAQLLLDEGRVVSPAALLEELLAVVAGQHHRGVPEQASGFQVRENPTELAVEVVDRVQIALADALDVALEIEAHVAQLAQVIGFDHRLRREVVGGMR
jgi:hypothetical protein